ncbi:type III-B CRISPR module RAMP protein Cmr6 [Rhodothermus marinus]|uniref:type III-B CRISPR module RAMP protein Cmr6 n=1 Tax=Rhodothermus marinus TaxID=29549 RepID=UPI001A7F0E37|nr:type III-B CRISPR module RAMP protein Cmr6 [Rhodothermus marinus]
MTDALRAQNYIVQMFTLCAASRVIVGLGAESVLETSIRLHRIYGFPIIPGSALKGVTRAYARLVEGKDEDDPIFAEVFGKSPPKAQAGKVIFFDAIPANPSNLTLELDVMNPHYGPYYQGVAPPADYHNPVPVFFLTIGPGSEFLFAVASRERGLAERAQGWLTKALTEMGIGAKTVAGYGLWRECRREARSGLDKEATESASSNAGSESDRPEVLKELPRKQEERIPAEVVDNRQRPVKVRLLVEGYADRIIPCTGARNLESFQPGTFIWVTVSQRAKDGTVRQVSLSGLWKSR